MSGELRKNATYQQFTSVIPEFCLAGSKLRIWGSILAHLVR